MKQIDLTPEGMKTEEGQRRISEALETLNDVDYKCFRILVRMMENEQVSKKYINEVENVLRERNLANERFMNALAGK